MLELSNIALVLKGQTLIQPFSLSVKGGEIVTLMGASGSGKSSLLSFVGGDLAAAFKGSGAISLGGRLLNDVPAEHRSIGRLFQDDLLFPHMTVSENLLFAIPKAPQVQRLQQMSEALRHAELSGMEDRAPHTLSGGQRSRVSLMRALLAKPAAMLLDEPFSKLDQDLRTHIRHFTFDEIRSRGIPVLLITHDQADVPEGGLVLQITATGEVKRV